jgi:hypothetical protein
VYTIIWVLFAHFPIEIFSNYYSAKISYSIIINNNIENICLHVPGKK